MRQSRTALALASVLRETAANPQVIELGLLRAQARFDVAQALAISQLREGHAEKLVEARERLDLVLAATARRSDETWSAEDAASVARTPAGLGASIIPAKSYFAGSQNRRPQFKSRPRKFIAFALLIRNLQTIQTQTLGHY